MNKLYLDVYNMIFLFCTHRELLSLSFCNKFLYNNINEKVWKRIGDRDHPLLKYKVKRIIILKIHYLFPKMNCYMKYKITIGQTTYIKQIIYTKII